MKIQVSALMLWEDYPVFISRYSMIRSAVTILLLLSLQYSFFQWFLDKIGLQGLNNLLAAYDDKSGYAQCIFLLSLGPEHNATSFVGRTDGTIVAARGSTDFGFVIHFNIVLL